jgi:hypothetical protein
MKRINSKPTTRESLGFNDEFTANNMWMIECVQLWAK